MRRIYFFWHFVIFYKTNDMCDDFNKLVEQYMMFDKKTLAELLAMKELAGRLDVPVVPSYPPTPQPIPIYPPYPWCPGIGDYPWWPQVWYTTKTTDGKEYQGWTPRNENEFSAGNAQYCGGLNRQDVINDTKTNLS